MRLKLGLGVAHKDKGRMGIFCSMILEEEQAEAGVEKSVLDVDFIARDIWEQLAATMRHCGYNF